MRKQNNFCKQINPYMEDKTSKYIFGFQKAHATQHSLITMLEKWKILQDKGFLFMDFSKTFDTINQDLLLEKVQGFSDKSLAFI